LPETLERSPDLKDPEKYFRERFKELFDAPFNLESKPGKRYSELLQKIPALSGNEDCLDLGCGAGLGTWMIAKSARYVLGIDSTEQAISFANKHYRKDGKIEFLTGDITRLNLNKKFHRVFLVHTLEHLPPKLCPVMLSEIFEILLPKGMLHISVPAEATLIYRYERLMEKLKGIPPWDPTHLTKFTVPSLKRLGKKAGFEIFRIDHKLFQSKKLNALHQKGLVPTWSQNPLTVEVFITLLKR